MVICHRLPFPPRRGGKIRPFNIISHLSQRHEVTVASLARSRKEREEGKGLEEVCARVLCADIGPARAVGRMLWRLPTRQPSSMGYFYSPRLAAAIDQELRRRQYDLILVHCSSVAQYVSGTRGVTKILDFGDMDSQKWLLYSKHHVFPKSLGYWLEGTKLLREEKRLARCFDLCTCTTQREWETLNAYGTGVETGWFPNGVDEVYFAPAREEYDPDLVSFTGRMDYFPNQQAMLYFCREVWPRIRAERPNARLVIVGAEPSAEVRNLGKLEAVSVTGSVPDVRPYVARSAVSVAPLHIARGTQNKILEAMAMGLPVVATTIAAGGIDATPGEHLLCADDPESFARLVLSLQNDRRLRQRFSEAGRERILERHTWPRAMAKMDELLRRLLGPAYREGETDAERSIREMSCGA